MPGNAGSNAPKATGALPSPQALPAPPFAVVPGTVAIGPVMLAVGGDTTIRDLVGFPRRSETKSAAAPPCVMADHHALPLPRVLSSSPGNQGSARPVQSRGPMSTRPSALDRPGSGMARLLGTATLATALGCGGHLETGSLAEAGVGDGGAADSPSADSFPADAPSGDACLSSRVPLNHRPAGDSCPSQRASAPPRQSCSCAGRDAGAPCSCGACSSDSDCTAGRNGRCENVGPVAFAGCSYDECLGDTDCDGGAPCRCRASGASAAANVCLTGSSCRDDSDCGPCGYCSPSAVDLCVCLSTALCGDAGGGCYAGDPAHPPSGPPPGPGWNPVPCACGDACGHGYFCHTRGDECVDDGDCAGKGTCNYDALARRWTCSSCVGIP